MVIHNNRYFKVDTKGRSASELAGALKKIKEIAKGSKGPNVGVLTVDDRDVWTDVSDFIGWQCVSTDSLCFPLLQARDKLMSTSKLNAQSIETIDSSILVICLDDAPAPKTEDERAWRYWVGGSDRSGSGKAENRWFDKHQLIVDQNGDSGFNGERESRRPSDLIATSLRLIPVTLQTPCWMEHPH